MALASLLLCLMIISEKVYQYLLRCITWRHLIEVGISSCVLLIYSYIIYATLYPYPSSYPDYSEVLLWLITVMRMVLWTTRMNEVQEILPLPSHHQVVFFQGHLNVMIRLERDRLSSEDCCKIVVWMVLPSSKLTGFCERHAQLS